MHNAELRENQVKLRKIDPKAREIDAKLRETKKPTDGELWKIFNNTFLQLSHQIQTYINFTFYTCKAINNDDSLIIY